ncbi:hypothetical protein HK104_004500 [Borealophlyctis nickersoniae]|nr:hypothetical protein HK104_004500 [Borealophlyctis nickersoniae]
MGVVASCFSGDLVNEAQTRHDQPTEQTPLLSGNNAPSTDNIPPAAAQHSHMKEQEALKRIVARTAENLIDISSVRMLDKIQPEHAAQRASQYILLLETCEPELSKILEEKLSHAPAPCSTDRARAIEQLSNAPARIEEKEQMGAWLGQVRNSMQDFKIEHLGDVVVPVSAVG